MCKSPGSCVCKMLTCVACSYYHSKQDASDGAKKLFSSLLQLLETREKASAEADSGLHSHDG